MAVRTPGISLHGVKAVLGLPEIRHVRDVKTAFSAAEISCVPDEKTALSESEIYCAPDEKNGFKCGRDLSFV